MIQLAENRLGRALLHLKCLARGGKWSWHLAGLRRELFGRSWLLVVTAFSFLVTFENASADENKPEATANLSGYYSEPFRPQFHFTPEKNWMNDPNGMVFYEGEYHLFYQYNPSGDKWGHMSWGHAVSSDLVHWKHLPLALAEENGVMIFSGSAVVDWKNTSGFGKDGKPPLVAIYTGHYTEKPLQNQQIAYSNDKGRTWTKYSGNPVLDIGEKDFRDPKVFWHEPTHQWVMVAAWPLERKVRFYASPNLKEWSHLSDFGPAGATKGIWECPDLFPLAIEGNTNQTKWVLIVNLNPGGPAGGSGSQYFVGDFDGQRFLLDASYPKAAPEAAKTPKGKVLTDFEGTNYADWKTTGTAFGIGPSHPSGGVDGLLGGGLADSFGKADSDQGTLTSPEFKIDADHVSFLIGGGDHPGKAGINLLIDGKLVRSATGNNSSQLQWKSWDVREFLGQNARVEIFDQYSGNDWGHIFVDHVVLGDEVPGTPAKYGLWLDYGRDFYAAVTWSGLPDSDRRRVALGWMSNWDYAQDVPTSPWRSAMTVPRILALRRTPEGLRLFQQPVAELDKIRDVTPQVFPGGTFAEAADWLASRGNLPQLLDMEINLDGVSTQTPFSLNLATGKEEQTSVVCDTVRGQLVVDRTRSGLAGFHRDFAGRYAAPLRLTDGRCNLRLLLDTSSLEVFAQDGETVLTDLIFPIGKTHTGSLVSLGEKAPTVKGIKLYRLKSTWKPANVAGAGEVQTSPASTLTALKFVP
jgi:sucrose-6-phosphate hydrolase SacC (GH32 family)